MGYMIILTLSLDENRPDGRRITMKDKLLAALGELLWGVIILYVLLMLCKNNYEMYAWGLLLLPFALHMLRGMKLKC